MGLIATGATRFMAAECRHPATLRTPSRQSELTSFGPYSRLLPKCEVPCGTKGVLVSEFPSQPISALLTKWRAGDQEALQALIPLVYRELRSIAQNHLRHERSDHTLQSTALVHEAYLRLTKQAPAEVENRAHFMAVASRLMRQILVDHARGHRAAKRGGGLKLELQDVMTRQNAPDVDLIPLDHALNELARLDPQQSSIVEMRFFGGLSMEDIAEVIGVSQTTVKREWATARAWLRRELKKNETQ